MKKTIYLLSGLMIFLMIGLNFSHAAEKVIKIANISALSGAAAPWGMAVQRGLRMAIEDFGTFEMGGDTYKWEVVDYDHKYNISDAVSAVNSAIFKENIRIGVIQGAGVHPPILPLIKEEKFLDWAFIVAGKKFTNPGNPTLFRFIPSSDQQLMTFYEDVYEKYKIKRVATLVPNDEMGKSDYELLVQLHEQRKLGVSISAKEFFERGMTDFYPALKRMLMTKPDLIFTDAAPPQTVALIAKQARELGFTNIIYSPTTPLEEKVLWDIAGKASDNIVAPRIFPQAPTKKFAELARRYEEKYKEIMPPTFAEVYPLIPWMIVAMKKANSIDNQKLIPTIADTPFKDHPIGPAYWGGEKYFGIKRQIIYPVPLCILKDQKWNLIETKEIKLD
jgi:branched-chain amino acid transport system substrate-binding protein